MDHQRIGAHLMSGIQQILLGLITTAAPTGFTWNPGDKSADIILSNGDLSATRGAGATNATVRGTQAYSTGKRYFEIACDTIGVSSDFSIYGIADSGLSLSAFVGSSAGSYGYETTGTKYNNGTGTAHGASFTAGDVIGIAVDLDAGKLWFAKNGTWQSGDPATGTTPAFTGVSGAFYPATSLYSTTPQHSQTVRFNTGDFTQTMPSGFTAWEP